MSEEYLLAWSEHHATFFSAMSELVSGRCHLGWVNAGIGMLIY